MSPTLSPSPSGLPPVDAQWGGLTKGGTYLLVGHANAGRPRHVMAVVQAAVQAGEHCLLISARPQESLVELASEVEFDLPQASQLQQVRLLKSPSAKDLVAYGDKGLAKALDDLVQLAHTHKAGRVVMDDFSSFVQFRVFDTFADVFQGLVENASAIQSTFVLGLGEPANQPSRNLLEFVESRVAGTIHSMSDDAGAPHFELLSGTAHHEPAGPSTTPFSEIFLETTAPPLDESEVTRSAAPSLLPETEPTPRDVSSLPPFELSIPTSDGGGSGKSLSTPDLVVPPSSPTTPAAPPAPIATPPQTSGDTAWARISPVLPATSAFIARGRDPFLRDIGDLNAIGYYIDSAGPEIAPDSATPEPAPTLEDAAAAVQEAAYPELFGPIPATSLTTDFQQALADAYARRGSEPFLVMALRIPADDPFANTFPSVAEGVRLGAGQSAMMLTGDQRLIVLIPNAGTDVARNVFAILKAHLKNIVPERADAALQHVNAMAVPNGEPFESAEELFAYAYGN